MNKEEAAAHIRVQLGKRFETAAAVSPPRNIRLDEKDESLIGRELIDAHWGDFFVYDPITSNFECQLVTAGVLGALENS